MNGNNFVRLCRDTEDSVPVNQNGFLRDFLAWQEKSVRSGRSKVEVHGDFVCYNEYGNSDKRVSVYKMNEEANAIELRFEINMEHDIFYILPRSYRRNCSDGTEYLLHSESNRGWTTLHLVNITKGEETWQKEYTRNGGHILDHLSRLGDGYLVLLKFNTTWTLETIQVPSGDTLSCHELQLSIPLKPGEEYLTAPKIRVQGKKIIVTIILEKYKECFDCFLLDADYPAAEPKQITIPFIEHYPHIKGVVFQSPCYLIACLTNFDLDMGSAFVFFDLETKVEVRRMVLSNVECVGPVNEFFLLRKLCDESEKDKNKTKLLLCCFNRSLKMLNSGLISGSKFDDNTPM